MNTKLQRNITFSTNPSGLAKHHTLINRGYHVEKFEFQFKDSRPRFCPGFPRKLFKIA
jgi:hypothetical protein